jgi:hypothetical protein
LIAYAAHWWIALLIGLATPVVCFLLLAAAIWLEGRAMPP